MAKKKHKRKHHHHSHDDHHTVMARIKEASIKGGAIAKEKGIHAAVATWKVVEPPPIKHRRQLVDHLKRIETMDAEVNKYSDDRKKYNEAFKAMQLQEAKASKSRHQRLERSAPSAGLLRDMRIEAEKQDRIKMKQDIERKRAEWREIDEQVRLEEEERDALELEKGMTYKRQMDILYWKKQAKENHIRAIEIEKQDRPGQIERERIRHEAETQAWRDAREHEEQFGEPIISPAQRDLGVFGTPMERGEYAGEIDGGYVSGVDDHTVGIPSTGPFNMAHEVERNQLLQYQSKVSQLEQKLSVLQDSDETRSFEKITLADKKERLCREIRQLDAEEREKDALISGPPRRDPTAEEIQESHVRKELRSSLKSNVLSINHRLKLVEKDCNQSDARRKNLESELSAVSKIASNLSSKIKSYEEIGNELPAIIGQSITAPETTVVNMRPSMMSRAQIEAIQQQSKFEILKGGAEPVFQAYEQSKALKASAWKLRGSLKIEGGDVDRSVARLAAVKNRLVEQEGTNRRLDLVRAIQRFHDSGRSLAPTKKVEKGPLHWYDNRDIHKSGGVIRYGSSKGVTLGLCDAGIAQGTIRLPFHGPWKIKFRLSISKKVGDDQMKSGDDSVQVMIGPDVGGLHYLGTYHSLTPEGEMEESQDVSYTVVGNSVAYRFDFRSSSSSVQMAIEGGEFEAEVKKQENSTESNNNSHFLSDFVEMLRIRENQTGHRTTVLLQELIAVEASTAENWDSRILHGHHQRFRRTDYAKQLRNAIKDEIARSIDHESAQRRKIASKSSPSVEDTTSEALSKVDLSALKHIERKKKDLEQQIKVDTKLLGRQIEFWEKNSNTGGGSWKDSFVKDMRFEWREGGSEIKLQHKRMTNRNSASITEHWEVMSKEKIVLMANKSTHYIASYRAHMRSQKLLASLQAQANKLEKSSDGSSLNVSEETQTAQDAEDAFFHVRAKKNIERIRNFTTYAAERELHSSHGRATLARMAEKIVARSGGDDNWEEALEMAKQDLVLTKVNEEVEKAVKYWKRQNERRIKARADALQAESDARSAELDEINRKRAEATRAEAQRSKDRMKDQLAIPNFEKALSVPMKCEHVRVKAWGSNYAQGLRCLNCGKELSRNYEDPDHARGADPELDKLVERHRLNEAAFRFEDSAELERVENERLRLEKERREIELREVQFYDFKDLKKIQELDRRHGLLSSPECSTREILDRHAASYRQEIQFYARVNHFRIRISKMITNRAIISRERAEKIDFLEVLHTEKSYIDDRLVMIQKDYGRAKALLDYRADVINIVKTSKVGLRRALKDKKKAYNQKEGTHEDACVAESHASSLLNALDSMEFTRKIFLDEKSYFQQQLLDAKAVLNEALESQASVNTDLRFLRYRRRGKVLPSTKYGAGVVTYYRTFDQMLMIRLAFGKASKAFYRISQLVREEECNEQAERLQMESSDTVLHEFYRQEALKMKRESAIMEQEEKEIRPFIEWENSLRLENEAVALAVKRAETEAHALLRTKGIQAEIQKQVNEKVAIIVAIKNDAKKKTGLGKKLRRARIYRAITKRLCMEFVEKRIIKAELETASKFLKSRDEACFNATITSFLETSVLSKVLYEIASDAIRADSTSRNLIETQTSIRFRHVNLPHDTYSRLYNATINRKTQQQVAAAAWASQEEALREAQVEMKKRDEIVKVKREIRARIAALCAEMRKEELFVKRFYRQEMILYIRERRGMRLNEAQMRDFLKAEERDRIERLHGKTAEKASAKDQRRLEIKRGKFENKRLKREWAGMTLEDDIAHAVRDVESYERAKQMEEEEALEQEALLLASFDDEDEDDEKEPDMFEESSASNAAPVVAVVAAPPKHESYVARKARLRQERLMEKRARLRAEAIRKKRAFLLEVDNEFTTDFVPAMAKATSVDLAVTNATIRVETARHDLTLVSSNLEILSKENNEKIALKAELVPAALAKRAFATEKTDNCERIDRHLRILTKQGLEYEAKKLLVIRETNMMDTQVLHKRPQRFNTEYLFGRLHTAFFESIIEQAIVQAQVIVTERQAMALTEEIQQNVTETRVKSANMSRLWTKNTRKARLRLRRSELGKLMFKSSQRRTLSRGFSVLVKYYTERTTVRAAYDLRYSLLRHQQEVDAFSKAAFAPTAKELPMQPTIMQTHENRWIECRNCKQPYAEAQNTRSSCRYHPGVYEEACPKSCESRKSNNNVSPKCMAHLMRRWVCCDELAEGKYGSTGCAYRAHMPPRSEPFYKSVVENSAASEERMLRETRAELAKVSERNVVRKKIRADKETLWRVEDKIKNDRELAKAYHSLRL